MFFFHQQPHCTPKNVHETLTSVSYDTAVTAGTYIYNFATFNVNG